MVDMQHGRQNLTWGLKQKYINYYHRVSHILIFQLFGQCVLCDFDNSTPRVQTLHQSHQSPHKFVHASINMTEGHTQVFFLRVPNISPRFRQMIGGRNQSACKYKTKWVVNLDGTHTSYGRHICTTQTSGEGTHCPCYGNNTFRMGNAVLVFWTMRFHSCVPKWSVIIVAWHSCYMLV